jgi:hypothetical protein
VAAARPEPSELAQVAQGDVDYVVERLLPQLQPVDRGDVAGYDRVIRQRLAAGATPVQLVDAGRSCTAVPKTSRVGLWTRHVDDALSQRAAATGGVIDLRPAQGPAHGPWCGTCDATTRMREREDDGRPYVCPDCHRDGIHVALSS